MFTDQTNTFISFEAHTEMGEPFVFQPIDATSSDVDSIPCVKEGHSHTAAIQLSSALTKPIPRSHTPAPTADDCCAPTSLSAASSRSSMSLSDSPACASPSSPSCFDSHRCHTPIPAPRTVVPLFTRRSVSPPQPHTPPPTAHTPACMGIAAQARRRSKGDLLSGLFEPTRPASPPKTSGAAPHSPPAKPVTSPSAGPPPPACRSWGSPPPPTAAAAAAAAVANTGAGVGAHPFVHPRTPTRSMTARVYAGFTQAGVTQQGQMQTQEQGLIPTQAHEQTTHAPTSEGCNSASTSAFVPVDVMVVVDGGTRTLTPAAAPPPPTGAQAQDLVHSPTRPLPSPSENASPPSFSARSAGSFSSVGSCGAGTPTGSCGASGANGSFMYTPRRTHRSPAAARRASGGVGMGVGAGVRVHSSVFNRSPADTHADLFEPVFRPLNCVQMEV